MFNTVANGKPVSPQILLMYMYGIYLSNGGTPEGFMSLSDDDFDMMSTAYLATEANRHRMWMQGMADVCEALFGKKE